MKKRLLTIQLFLLAACTPPNPAQPPTEKQTDLRKFYDQSIGWSFSYPKEWIEIPIDESKRIRNSGKDYIEKNAQTEVLDHGIHTVINIQRNKANDFSATLQPYEKDDWKEENKRSIETMIRAFESQGVKVNHSEISEIILDGILFETIELKVTTKSSDKIWRSKMYSTKMDTNVLGIVVSCMDPKAYMEIVAAFEKSKFDRKT